MPWFTITRETFSWLGTASPAQYRSSENGLRYFCSLCGTHLLFEYSKEGSPPPVTVDVATATLDEAGRGGCLPPSVLPASHTFWEDGASWHQATILNSGGSALPIIGKVVADSEQHASSRSMTHVGMPMMYYPCNTMLQQVLTPFGEFRSV